MDEFNLGDIVCFKSHPYLNNVQKILVGGEAQLHPPLMVVSECLKELKDQYDEKSGDEVNIKGEYQCKCLWYSSRTNQFEEHWVSSKSLKHFKYEVDRGKIDSKESIKKIYQNQLVILKTSQIELGKLKSSLSVESSTISSAKDKNIINPLLTFVPPVMQVIQVIEPKTTDQKEPIYDQKTGHKKRFLPQWLLKCKWYNPNEKFSERIIPIECVEIIPVVGEDIIENIINQIESLGYLEYNNTILQPKNLLFVSGIYYLKAFDYLKNTNEDIKIEPDSNFIAKSNLTLEVLPKFNFSPGATLPDDYFTSQIINEVNSRIPQKYFLRIYYTNRLDVTSYRTLKNYEIVSIKEGGKDVSYLRAYCLLRKENRYFRVDRINKLQVLDIKYI